MYYVLVYLIFGIEFEYYDEEDDGNLSEQENGYKVDQDEILFKDDDISYVGDSGELYD